MNRAHDTSEVLQRHCKSHPFAWLMPRAISPTMRLPAVSPAETDSVGFLGRRRDLEPNDTGTDIHVAVSATINSTPCSRN